MEGFVSGDGQEVVEALVAYISGVKWVEAHPGIPMVLEKLI